jgi:hypothetical protein
VAAGRHDKYTVLVSYLENAMNRRPTSASEAQPDRALISDTNDSRHVEMCLSGGQAVE